MKEFDVQNSKEKSWQELLRVREYNKHYMLKMLTPSEKVLTVYYPTLQEDGTLRTVAFTVSDYKSNPLAKLADMEVRIKKDEIYARMGKTEEAQKEAFTVRSKFNPSSAFHYLVLDKDDPIPVVRQLSTTQTVKNGIIEKVKMNYFNPRTKQEDLSKLQNGLSFMLWFDILRKYKDATKKDKNPMLNTEYETNVVSEFCSNFKGKFDSTLRNAEKVRYNEDNITVLMMGKEVLKLSLQELYDYGMFTENEYTAVLNYDEELKTLVKPQTREEIIEKLIANPIQINARDGDKGFMYASWEKIAEQMDKMHLEFPINTNSFALEEHKESKDEDKTNVDAFEKHERESNKKAKSKKDSDDLDGLSKQQVEDLF